MILVFDIDHTRLTDWARWVAQDQDGYWWAYEVEPLQFHKGWYENEVGRNKRLAHELKSKDWKNTLLRVNKLL